MTTKQQTSSVIVIGAGIGGLSTGCYLAMNGYTTHILEKGSCSGGVSVAWQRGNYLFDGATNWLPGSGPKSNLHALLGELIDFSAVTIDDPEIFIQVENDGHVLRVYTDADQLETEMTKIAPEDCTVIREFTRAVREASRHSIPFDKPPELFTPFDYLRFPFANMAFIRFFTTWRRTSIGDFALRFKSPVLRSLFLRIFPHHDFFSVFSVIMALGWMHARAGGYPFGGSNHFAALLEQRFRKLGGTITFNRTVTEILVRNGCACGVRCSDGTILEAEVVVPAIDGRTTLFDLLGNRHTPAIYRQLYASGKVFPALIQVSIGVRRPFDEHAHKFCIMFDQPLDVGGSSLVDSMMVRLCNFDPVFAPEGKTALVVHLRVDNWKWWTTAREQSPQRYRAEKERIAAAIIQALDQRFGDIASTVETVDVATPATFIRYTGIWQGSYQGWAPTPSMVGRSLPKTLPGLRNCYLAGQWVWPAGGLPGVMRIGRNIAQIICRRDRRKFVVVPAKEHS